MRKGWLGLWFVLVCGVPAAAHAQAAWDAPLLLPPQPTSGFGIFLVDVHRGGLGVEVLWRGRPSAFGLRAGISEGAGDEDLAVFGGIDFTGLINRATSDFPLDIAWVFGAGLGASDGVRLAFPLGLTAGHTFRAEGADFTPYATPRVTLDAFFGRDDPPAGTDDDDLDLGFSLDLGLDMRFTGGSGAMRGVTIRFGGTLGDREAVAIGLVFSR